MQLENPQPHVAAESVSISQSQLRAIASQALTPTWHGAGESAPVAGPVSIARDREKRTVARDDFPPFRMSQDSVRRWVDPTTAVHPRRSLVQKR